jgi:hypothetical protein
MKRPTIVLLSRMRAAATLMAAALTLAQVGCQNQTASSHDDHANAEEHDRPEHMPISLAASVPELRQRIAKLKNDGPRQEETRQAQGRELRDIIRWLPELAGDSDLRKADWETVNEASHQLETLLEPLWSGPPSESIPDAEVGKIMDKLEKLAVKSQSREESTWK